MSKPNIFFKLTKVDVEKRTVEGIATAEVADKAGEICDYETTKPFYQKWSDGIKKASGGKSLGNVRAMHGNVAAGKITDIIFDDVAKCINIVAKIVDDAEWKKVVEGVYTGFSQGGEYIKRWADGDFTRYTAEPSEVSIVDNPCLGIATFAVVKADGVVETKEFKKAEPEPEVEQGWRAKDGSFHKTKAEALKKNVEIDAEAAAQAAIAATKESIEAANAELDKKAKGDDEEDGEGEDDEAKKAAAAEDTEDDEAKEKKKAEKAEAIGALKKYEGAEIWDASLAFDALKTIHSVLCNEQWQAQNGEEEAAQVEMLRTVIGKLKKFIASELKEDNSEPLAASAPLGELQKSFDEKLEKSEALNKSLTKALEDVNGLVSNLVKRIDTLEKSPAPRKGSLFVVERETVKSHESLTGETAEAAPINLTALRLSPEDMRKARGF